MPELYDSHDLFVQTPSVDNMPLSVLEAFACGLPVVSTEAGGVPTILTHGVHGLLARVDDHESIASGVLTLLDNPEMADRLARAAHATCDAYTWPVVREQWLRAYRGIARVEPERTRRQSAEHVGC
jgi:glycosyltransferase involved in cell wall biosynthesis